MLKPLDGARKEHLAAPVAAKGAEFDDMLGAPDHIGIVLDHHDRVADIAQLLDNLHHPLGVVRMESRRGLIEHVERVGEHASEAGGEDDAVDLTAGEGLGLPHEREVAEACVGQIAEPLADLGDEPFERLLKGRSECDGLGPEQGLIDAKREDVSEVEACDSDRAGVGVKTGALALAADGEATIAHRVESDAAERAVGQDLFEPAGGAAPALVAVKDAVLVRLREAQPGDVDRDALGHAPLEHLLAWATGGGDVEDGECAPLERERWIGNGLVGVEPHAPAEPFAAAAGAERIEGVEERGHGLFVRSATTAADPSAMEGALLAAAFGFAVPEDHGDGPFGELEGCLERLAQPQRVVLYGEAVDDDLDLRGPYERDGGLGFNLDDFAFEPGALVAVCDELSEKVAHAVCVGAGGGNDEDPLAARMLLQPLDGSGYVEGDNRGAAGLADNLSGTRKEDLKVVEQLGERGDGGLGVGDRAALPQRDGGWDVGDGADGRLGHGMEELPGVGGEGLHVSALPFGIERVEGERRLAAAAHARDDRERTARDGDIDGLEVVGLGAADDDVVSLFGRRLWGEGGFGHDAAADGEAPVLVGRGVGCKWGCSGAQNGDLEGAIH